MTDTDRRDIYLFCKKARKLRRKLSLGTGDLTPFNFDEENEKFFNSLNYNPQYKYAKKDLSDYQTQIAKLNFSLEKMHLPKELGLYLQQYLNNLEILAETIEAIGTEQFDEKAKRLFNWDLVDPKLITQDLPDPIYQTIPSAGIYNAKEIKQRFEKVIAKRYQIDNFKVITDKKNCVTIRVGGKKLCVGKRVKRNSKNLRRLIVHEIESHLLQNYNLRKRHPLLSLTSYSDSMIFGEGLAVYNEVNTQMITRSAYKTYYYRLKAVGMLNKSFREIYDYLCQFLSPKKAFLITFRVKRGMSDTSKAGGFSKDAAYLFGYRMMHEYIKSGGDIDDLYLCKVPHLLKLARKYDLLDEADYLLPKFMTIPQKEITQPKIYLSN